MSDGKLFVKTKSSELKAELEQVYKKPKPHSKVKLVLKKVVANIILNNHEIARLLPDIISLLRFDDLEIRRTCLDYLSQFCQYDPAEAVKLLPFLKRFKDDSSPILRALNIKTLTSIKLPDFVDLSFQTINQYLKDPSPYVRIQGAFAVARLFFDNSSRVINNNLIDELNELLYDTDETVIAVALSSLDSIIDHDRTLDLSLTLRHRHAIVLLKNIPKASEWSQIYILNALMSYVPEETERALELIELIMPFLQHENSAVVLNAIKTIVFLSNYVKNPELILPALPKRLGSSLVSLLSRPPEIQFLVLRNVILLLLGRKELVHFEIDMFFCKYDDMVYVKDTKLEIIYLLANENNVMTVLKELEEYATEVDIAMARKAIRAFGNLAVKLSGAAPQCVQIIIELVSNGISYIVQESAVIIRNIVRRYPGRFNNAVLELSNQYQLIEDADAKASMIWIVGQHCKIIPNSDKILKSLTKTYREDPLDSQYNTLTAVIKLYLNDPNKGEALTLEILKWATEEADNPDLRERGFFYWRLISTNPGDSNEFQEFAKLVVLNNNPLISSDNDNINPEVLEELELNIGTLASIYLKPINQVFRLAKTKKLPQSTALQPRKLTPPNADTQTPDQSRNSSTDTLSKPPPLYNSRHLNSSSEKVSRRPSLIRQHSGESELSNESLSRKQSLVTKISRRTSLMKKKGQRY